jgi:hypothetical protein
MKYKHVISQLFILTLLLSSCSPTPIPLGPLSITLTPSSATIYFGGCDPRSLQVDAILHGDMHAVDRVVLGWGFNLPDMTAPPGANGVGNQLMSTSTPGTYTYVHDFGMGPGWGRMDFVINVDVRALDSSGAVLATANLTGLLWRACPLPTPEPGVTLVRASVAPVEVFYGNATACPSSLATFTAEIFDPGSQITSVRIVSHMIDGTTATVLTPAPFLLTPTGGTSPDGGQLYTASLDINSLSPAGPLGGASGALVWTAEGIKGTGEVAAHDEVSALFLRPCAAGIIESTPAPTMTFTPTVPSIFVPSNTPIPVIFTHTPIPPPLACSTWTIEKDCWNASCYWWKGTCNDKPDGCAGLDEIACNAAVTCKWDPPTSTCYTP